jgi:acetyl esterase/lipase
VKLHICTSLDSQMRQQLACSLMDAVMAPVPSFPIHPAMAARLHPQYVAFYNKHLIHQMPAHLLPLKLARENGKATPGSSEPVPVGKTEDFLVKRKETAGPDVRIRCFTPPGPAPCDGWPVMLYSHGGGWVLGTIDSENSVCTRMCARARCVVVTTGYR